MNLTAFFPEQVEYKSARDGDFCVVNPDFNQVWSSADWKYYKNVSRPTRNNDPYGDEERANGGGGLPATARFVDDTPVKFTRDLQFFVHEMCYNNNISDKENKNSFRSLWRDKAAMSNFAGTTTRADYINENGLPPEIQIQPMAMGGSLLKIIGETTLKHTPCYLVEAVHPDRPEECINKLWLKFYPSNSVRRWYFDDKKNVIKKEEFYNEPFSQYDGNCVVPVFGFRYDERSSTKYCNVIEKYRVRLLGDSPIPNPWIIRDGRTKENPYLSG